MMRIYLYTESCPMGGRLAPANIDLDEDGYPESADFFQWGEGTEEELIQQALDRLSRRTDPRPGGAGDSFNWKCCRNVLEALDGPEVEFDKKSMSWTPVEEETED